MKKKHEEYLPLNWVRKMKQQTSSVFGTLDYEDLVKINDPTLSLKEGSHIFIKYPNLKNFIAMMEKRNLFDDTDTMAEFWHDMDAVLTIEAWAQDKQVIKFDSDFLDELINTENIIISETFLDHLPYNSFYIDLSDNKKLSKKFSIDGLYVRVETVKPPNEFTGNNYNEWYKSLIDRYGSDKYYSIHVCRINNKYYTNNIITIPAMNCSIPENILGSEVDQVSLSDFDESTGERIIHFEDFNSRDYYKMILQILLYLSSKEPDIIENEETKKTYKKTKAVKNKYSEVRKWNVGIRYGSSIRAYNSYKENKRNVIGTGNGSVKRPHVRRAHWHSYWYKENGERIKRIKWVHQMYINNDFVNKNNPVVVHKVLK